jgi:hypothetical protein
MMVIGKTNNHKNTSRKFDNIYGYAKQNNKDKNTILREYKLQKRIKTRNFLQAQAKPPTRCENPIFVNQGALNTKVWEAIRNL